MQSGLSSLGPCSASAASFASFFSSASCIFCWRSIFCSSVKMRSRRASSAAASVALSRGKAPPSSSSIFSTMAARSRASCSAGVGSLLFAFAAASALGCGIFSEPCVGVGFGGSWAGVACGCSPCGLGMGTAACGTGAVEAAGCATVRASSRTSSASGDGHGRRPPRRCRKSTVPAIGAGIRRVRAWRRCFSSLPSLRCGVLFFWRFRARRREREVSPSSR